MWVVLTKNSILVLPESLVLTKVGDYWAMTSKPVVLRVPINELPTLVEGKSKRMALNNKPEPMSLPINDLS